MIQDAIAKLVDGLDLSLEESRQVADEIMSGEATPIQIGSFLVALRAHGEKKENLLGFAKSMREKVLPIEAPQNEIVMDTCGTGGDKSQSFNISTVAAFIIAGAGVKVAKHGNRSVSGQCGSADVLEELGINLTPPKEIVEQCLRELGICFIFAPMCHKAMKFAAQPRREIGIRTIFNMVGPIVNPALITHHLLGVFSEDVMAIYAEVLKDLGLSGAVIVHSEDGMDELTTTARTKIMEFKDKGEIVTRFIEPEDYGFKRAKRSEIQGADKETNATIMLSVFRGTASAYMDTALLNAGTGLYIAGKAETIEKGIEQARKSITSGAAMEKLEALREMSKSGSD